MCRISISAKGSATFRIRCPGSDPSRSPARSAILSGFVNAWILVASFRGLVETGYGQLLMLKLAAFAVMLALAAFNRFALTPRLAVPSGDARQDALRALSRNTLIEIALGLSIFAMVGVLGMLHPAAHLVN
jgi:putative copper resistance protein D